MIAICYSCDILKHTTDAVHRMHTFTLWKPQTDQGIIKLGNTVLMAFNKTGLQLFTGFSEEYS